MTYSWEYEDVIDWVSCEDCLKAGYKVLAKKFVNERDLCEECYEQCPKCVGCGTLEFNTDNAMCAPCIDEDKKDREETASAQTLFFEDAYLQNVADIWSNINRYL